jgi:hypothetical protein
MESIPLVPLFFSCFRSGGAAIRETGVRDTGVDTDAVSSQRGLPMWGQDFILPPAF